MGMTSIEIFGEKRKRSMGAATTERLSVELSIKEGSEKKGEDPPGMKNKSDSLPFSQATVSHMEEEKKP